MHCILPVIPISIRIHTCYSTYREIDGSIKREGERGLISGEAGQEQKGQAGRSAGESDRERSPTPSAAACSPTRGQRALFLDLPEQFLSIHHRARPRWRGRRRRRRRLRLLGESWGWVTETEERGGERRRRRPNRRIDDGALPPEILTTSGAQYVVEATFQFLFEKKKF